MAGIRISLIALCALAVGCAGIRPQRGGRSVITTSPGNMSIGPAAAGSTFELTQPENPATASTQIIERTTEFLNPGQAAPVLLSSIPQTAIPNPQSAIHRTTERISTTLGAAQKDTARELSAKLAAMRPALWVGLACIPVAGAFTYFGWYSPALIAAGTGIGLMLFSQAIATHTTLLLVIACAVAAILLIFRAYDRGRIDPILPDRLDRFPQKLSGTTVYPPPTL